MISDPTTPTRETSTVDVQPTAQAQAVIAPEPTDRWAALRQIGYWKGIDFVLLFLWLAVWVTTGFWKLFGDPSAFHLLCMIGASIGIIQIWGLIIAFRCMDFVLQARARLEMLPYDAAKIAVGYMQGGQGIVKQ
jgi:hypothetical protein